MNITHSPYVNDLQIDNAVIFGVTLRRPIYMTSSDWQSMWRGNGPRQYIPVDWGVAKPFDARIIRPVGVTGEEWINFWRNITLARI